MTKTKTTMTGWEGQEFRLAEDPGGRPVSLGINSRLTMLSIGCSRGPMPGSVLLRKLSL